MRRILLIFVMIAFPASAMAQIAGSAHDFSTALATVGGETCVVCHTPHNADVTVSDAPLWNHALSAVATYTIYSSTTLDATVGQPTGLSKLCLSCHDGTVGIEAYGAVTTGTNFIGLINAAADVGTTLANDHPISFVYNTALAVADGELEDPSLKASGLGGTVDADLLFGGAMECASCHDVHNTAGNTSLLRVSNANSALCLTCHQK